MTKRNEVQLEILRLLTEQDAMNTGSIVRALKPLASKQTVICHLLGLKGERCVESEERTESKRHIRCKVNRITAIGAQKRDDLKIVMKSQEPSPSLEEARNNIAEWRKQSRNDATFRTGLIRDILASLLDSSLGEDDTLDELLQVLIHVWKCAKFWKTPTKNEIDDMIRVWRRQGKLKLRSGFVKGANFRSSEIAQGGKIAAQAVMVSWIRKT